VRSGQIVTGSGRARRIERVEPGEEVEGSALGVMPAREFQPARTTKWPPASRTALRSRA